MNFRWVLAALLLPSSLVLAETPVAPVAVSAAIPMTRQLDFTSAVNQRRYRLQVALPVGKAPPAGFPVIYVIDGDGYFGTWAFAARMRAMSDELEHSVVVGVGYPEAEPDIGAAMQRRMNELVPSLDPMAGKLAGAVSGQTAAPYAGADELLRMLHEEAPVQVAAVIPIDRSRSTLFGHSLGGLFALHALFTHPEYFHTYLVLSPSIWWNNRSVLAARPAFLQRVRAGEVAPRVYIAVGSLEQPASTEPLPGGIPPGMTEAEARQLVANAAMVDNARGMLESLQVAGAPSGYEVQGRVVPRESHVSVAWAALNEMLDFAVGRK